jgi:hypothetical protein
MQVAGDSLVSSSKEEKPAIVVHGRARLFVPGGYTAFSSKKAFTQCGDASEQPAIFGGVIVKGKVLGPVDARL